ncbi:hypothetical protein GALL_449170 [mine drainage metagenome]|uniref:DUF883 domain-containing protein n=1 Tax=mine drainage metagenome TaxID=410659 RepID=A0A1J5PPN9_9ZZZZ
MILNKPVDAASSLIDQASQSADQAIKSTQQAATEALQVLSQALHDLRHQAVPLAEHAADQVASLTQRGLDGVQETSHHLRVKAEHASASTVNYIKHDPMKSVLIAAATGAALMALISLVSHSRDRG